MASSYPTGAIPLVEAQWSHRAFVHAAEPAYALVKLTTARQLVKRDETAASYFPAGTTVITTSTIPDTKLNLISWENELAIVEAFGPSWHIPTDFSTYENQAESERQANVERCLEGTLWMRRKLDERDSDISLIPLMKGCTPAEWAICYETLDRCAYNFPMTAFFGTQYFTGDAGIRITELVADVREIATRQPRPILLIGLLSPTYLRRMPASVNAGTGLNQWRKPVTPTKQTDEEMQAIWHGLRDDVSAALTQPGAAEHGDRDAPAPEQEVA